MSRLKRYTEVSDGQQGQDRVGTVNSVREDDDPELPVWKKKISFRGQPYRYARHQHSVMGHFKVRVVAAAELSEPEWALLNTIGGVVSGGAALRPFVTVSFGKSHERTPSCEMEVDCTGVLRATWTKEILVVEAMKGAVAAGEPALLGVQVFNQDGMVQSALGVLSSVMGSHGSLLGSGELEVTPLLSGGVSLIDTWVEVEPKGRVHLLVEYDPKGLQPRQNSVVYLESFARWDESLVIPPGEPMMVLSVKERSLLVAFDTPTGREGRVRLHRNCVFVVESLSWVDVAIATAARPVDALLRTDTGSWLVRRARPLVSPLLVLAAPLHASLVVAMTTAKMAFRGALMGTQALVHDSMKS